MALDGVLGKPEFTGFWGLGNRRCGRGKDYLLANEITLLVASASCWHLIFSAVAFSNAEVRLLRLALSS